MKKKLVIIICFFMGLHLSSQTNVCGVSATLLTVGSTCSNVAGSTVSATGGGTGCSTGTNDDDVWYRFVATSDVAQVTVTGSSNFDAVLSCYTSCAATTPVTGGTCTDATANGGVEVLNLTGLTPGATYYIQVYDWSIGNGNFNICITNTVNLITNDECTGAIALNTGTSCVLTPGTTSGATQSLPGCIGNANEDVWYSFVPTTTGENITLAASVSFNGVVEIFFGTCTSLTSIGCNDAAYVSGSSGSANFPGLSPGQTYYLRVYDYYLTPPSTPTFSICAQSYNPPVAPPNDNCFGAVALTADTTCVFTAGTTLNANQALPGCIGNANDDVWYAFMPQNTGASITVNTNSSFDPVVELFSGSCLNLNSIGCEDDLYPLAGGTSNFVGLTIGQTYYFRIYDRGSGIPTNPTFSVCVKSITPPTPNFQDCLGAIPICSTITSNTLQHTGTGNVPHEINYNTSCLTFGEKNDVWYQFTIQTPGDLCFSINPDDNTTDFDWALFDLSNNNCTEIFSNSSLESACNYSPVTSWTTGIAPSFLGSDSTGNTGLFPAPHNTNAQTRPCLNVVAGQHFVLNISKYWWTSPGFNLYFPPNGTPGMASIIDNSPPAINNLAFTPLCGSDSLRIKLTEDVSCTIFNPTSFTLTGPDGAHLINSISSADCNMNYQSTNELTVHFSPALTTQGTYTLCMNSGFTDLCGNPSTSSCFNFSLTNPINILLTTSGSGCSGTGTITSTITGGTPGYNYSWAPSGNGLNLTGLNSGTYTLTVVDTVGCVNSKSISVSEGNTYSQSITICNGQSITVNGHVYTTSGSYIDTILVSGSCDSILTSHLTVLPVISGSQTLTICAGDSILIGSNTYNASGTYVDTLTASSGCDSIVFTNLTMQYFSLGPDTFQCNGSVNLNAQNPGSTYLWNTGDITQELIVSQTGVYYVEINTQFNCSLKDTIAVTIDQCVWPGDTDYDLSVTQNDLLPIGVFFNETGNARNNASNNWNGQTSIDWSQNQISGVNIKHANCNGDTIIEFNDTLAVHLNFNFSHTAKLNPLSNINTTNPDVYFMFDKPFYYPGDTVNAEVLIGSSQSVQSGFYGTAFEIHYNSSMIVPLSESFAFTNSWVGNINQSCIKFSHLIPGNIYCSLVKITHQDTSGFGKIADFKFVLLNNLTPGELLLSITNGIKTDNLGNMNTLNSGTDTVHIVPNSIGLANKTANSQCFIYPNPSDEKITVVLPNNIEQKAHLSIINLLGQVVYTSNLYSVYKEIDISQFSQGIYLIKIELGEGESQTIQLIKK